MTDDEYRVWSKRLFVAFPSLWEWLQASSPDAKQTQEIWRDTLRRYTFDECLWVVTSWSSGSLEPFAAYERDKVHLLVRSHIEFQRDRRAKSQRSNEESRRFSESRRTVFDVPGVYDAFKRGMEIKKGLMAGSLDQQEANRRMRELLEAIE